MQAMCARHVGKGKCTYFVFAGHCCTLFYKIKLRNNMNIVIIVLLGGLGGGIN